MEITAIILAGGRSTRMGTDKALLLINNKTLLENAIDICKSVCNNIIISSNFAEHENFGHKVIPDEIKNCGPIAGIYSCLKKSESDWNLVFSVDTAFVQKELIEFLIKNTYHFDAVVPKHNKGQEPLVALYNKSVIPYIKNQLDSGDFKMQNLLKEINSKYINTQYLVEKNPNMFSNLNRPDDLQIVSK
jgi:molybdopterin-guanine dinucleotide biosynthesis protein A